jgi:ubiquinone biosynthesis protein
LKRIPDLPDLMDRADYALKLMAEGKLSLGISNNKGLEIEQIKLKNFRNNIIICFFSIVIISLLVF